MLSLGVIARSRKENEQRLPIHPDHFDFIPQSVRSSMRFENGYGKPFNIADDELVRRFGGVAARGELLGGCDVVLLPKPQPEDLLEMREGGILWGWPHCVQGEQITHTFGFGCWQKTDLFWQNAEAMRGWLGLFPLALQK